MKTKHKTREGWLLEAVSQLRPLFKKHKAAIPAKVMVGCGWPKGGKSEVIGQCFGKTWTEDGTSHIFISPTQGDNIEVLAVLVHELAHAAVGVECGHRGEFKRVARALGLEGKLTATFVSKASPLYQVLEAIAKKLGQYPHAKMKRGGKKGSGYRSWERYASRTIVGYKVIMSRKLVEEFGVPKDPNGRDMYEIPHRVRKAA